MTIGFIGLGSQGGPMARRLIDEGHELMLWARRPESLEPYRDTSALTAESVAALGAACAIVAICVVDDAGVEALCSELITAMPPGGVIVIHSTIHPRTCMALDRQARAHGLSVVDAPVSGGGPGAANRTLTVMVGGDDAAVARVRPLFEAFAGLIVHLGGVGAGQGAKLVNNTLMAANMANAHFALSCGDAMGIDRQVLAELIRVSSGRSFGFDVYARQPSLASFEHGARLLAKDVRLLSDMLERDAGVAALKGVAMTYLDAVADAVRSAATDPASAQRTSPA